MADGIPEDITTDRWTGYVPPDSGEVVCEECLSPAEAEDAHEFQSWDESDSPICCGRCFRPVRGSLTGEGVRGVLEDARERLKDTPEDRDAIMVNLPGTYWHGSRAVAPLRMQVEILRREFGLNARDKRFCELFLHYTKPRTDDELRRLRLPEALRPHVSDDGTFHYSADGGYPLVYYSKDCGDSYCRDCAQTIYNDCNGRERPVALVEVLWEIDNADDWPLCDECHNPLHVAYPPDGYECSGEKSAT